MKDILNFVVVYLIVSVLIVGGLYLVGAPSWFESKSSDRDCYVEYGSGIGGSSEIICY